ncbi:Uncharacterised protein [uncultured archaeon]|nr:Uncharacterised protein [uncultured archaeon]
MVTMRNKKGQATIEYLVLLAVAIIIALVIFAFMGWVPGFAGSLKERQVRLFWSSQFPIQIRDYKVTNSSGGMEMMVQNVGDSKIEILNITAAGVSDTTLSPSGTSARLAAGESKVFTADAISCTGIGEVYELENVSIGYNVVDGISGMVETGERPLVGRCQSG